MSELTLSRPSARRRVRPDAEAATLADVERAVALASAPDAPDALTDEPALADYLYARWWAGWDATMPTGESRVGALEVARRSASPIEHGLLVLASDGRRIVAARHAGEPPRTLAADAVVASSRPGCPARPGDLVSVIGGTGGPDADDAWWWAETGPGASGRDRPVVRWYVHVRSHDAPLVVAATVRLAARVGVPLLLKCPTRESGYGRRDGLVVYVAREDAQRLEAGFEGWWDEVRDHVDADAPPFTRPLAPGVGAADDPGGDVSYGQLRCGQVASAIAELRRRPDADPLALLRAAGVDPRRPEEVAR